MPCSSLQGSAKPVWGSTVRQWGMEAAIAQSTVFLAKVAACSLASCLEIFLLTLFITTYLLNSCCLFVSGVLFGLFCQVVAAF